jgi:hypothetical protein
LLDIYGQKYGLTKAGRAQQIPKLIDLLVWKAEKTTSSANIAKVCSNVCIAPRRFWVILNWWFWMNQHWSWPRGHG